MNLKRFIVSMLCVFSLVGMTACNATPNDAADVFENYRSAVEKNGYNIAGNLNATMAFSYDQENYYELPINLTIDADTYGDNMHGTLDIDMDLFGSTTSSAIEFYCDTNSDTPMVYFNTDDSGWVYSESESGNIINDFTNKDVGTLETSDDSYIVKTTLTEALGEETAQVVAEGIAEYDPDFEVDVLMQMFNDAVLVYTFDAETYHLVNLSMDEITYSSDVDTENGDADVTGEETSVDETTDTDNATEDDAASVDEDDSVVADGDSEDYNVSMKLALSFNINFDDYGNVSANDVAIPDTVKESAVDSTATD